jgi:hypothetical protein
MNVTVVMPDVIWETIVNDFTDFQIHFSFNNGLVFVVVNHKEDNII